MEIHVLMFLVIYLFPFSSVGEKENTEFKPALLYLEIDILSHNADSGGVI